MDATSPRDSVSCGVTFAALWPGLHSAAIWFGPDPGVPQSFEQQVYLNGVAAEWPSATYPPHMNFGELAVGDSLSLTCTLVNTAGDNYVAAGGKPRLVWRR